MISYSAACTQWWRKYPDGRHCVYTGPFVPQKPFQLISNCRFNLNLKRTGQSRLKSSINRSGNGSCTPVSLGEIETNRITVLTEIVNRLDGRCLSPFIHVHRLSNHLNFYQIKSVLKKLSLGQK